MVFDNTELKLCAQRVRSIVRQSDPALKTMMVTEEAYPLFFDLPFHCHFDASEGWFET